MTMHPMQEYIQKLCNKNYKIKLFANLGANLFQESGGLSRRQELINNEKKQKNLSISEVPDFQKGMSISN